jgi:type IV secretion system protein VirD4
VFFQNVGQMRNRYPNDQWQEILGACDSTVFLGCTDMLTAEYFSNRAGVASVEVESEARELNTMRITNYTPNYRKTNSLGRRQLLTPDEVQRLPLDSELIFIRGMKPLRAKRFDYSNHPEYKKLRSEKAILHEPDWKTSQAQTVSACPTVSAIPDQKPARPDGKSQDQQKKPTDDPQVKPKGGKLIDLDEIF